jgi:diadenosine tetraphosphate (Ap4A) HIT family hydrolase
MEWSADDHANTFTLMQRIVSASPFTNNLIYGKATVHSPFSWEVVPYAPCKTALGVIIQQVRVLWNIAFGGLRTHWATHLPYFERYQALLERPIKSETDLTPVAGTDPFCQDATIQRQWILTGEKVNLLLSHAPIGFGGERLHFLAVPKAHHKRFVDISAEEYAETMTLTHKLITRLAPSRSIQSVYLLNKTGKVAGQVVDHWLMHIIIVTNPAQDFWGKWTVFKNILFGSSAMDPKAFNQKVFDLRREMI